MGAHSIYIHIPFCTHRCGYCDFNTYAGLEDLIPAYTAAMCAEIRFTGQNTFERLPVHTIFFGGGTPSLLPAQAIEQILSSIDEAFDLQPEPEITLEANPGTLSAEYLRALSQSGVNRLSLGVQSADPGELRLLERVHDYPTVTRSVAWARRAGFNNLNLDLIFGLPEQPMHTWQQTLHLAIGLQPEHFSLYALTLEHGTPFGRWARRGLLSTPDPDLAADMYEWASECLEDNGYTQYEISNWARRISGEPDTPTASPALACRHNLQYWRNQPYLGFGAGAHGFAAAQRTANVLSPTTYVARLANSPEQPLVFPRTPATQNLQPIDVQTEIGETMMMGLRLVREGVSETAFQKRFGHSLEEVFARQIGRFIGYGLLEWAESEGERCLRLTQRGRLLGNQVFSEFI